MRFTRVVPVVAGLAALALVAEAGPGHRGRGHRAVVRPSFGFYGVPFWGSFAGGFASPWWGPAAYRGYTGIPGWDQAAAVRLQVEPREAEVYVDGHYAGLVDDFDGTFQRLRLLPGNHTLELYLEGHRSVRRDVHVGPGHTLKVEFVMEPLAGGEAEPARPALPEDQPSDPPVARSAPEEAPPPPRIAPVRRDPAPQRAGAFGQLVLRTQPGGVQVWIDGERWPADSNGSLTLHLPAGVHRVELRRPGHDSFSTEIEVRSDEARELNVRLRADGSSL